MRDRINGLFNSLTTEDLKKCKIIIAICEKDQFGKFMQYKLQQIMASEVRDQLR